MRSHRIAGHLVEELVSANLDHSLTPEVSRTLEEHLRGCLSCRGLVARQERLRTGLRELSAPIASRDSDALWVGIASRRARPHRAFPRGLVQVGLAAAVLVVAAGTSVVLLERRPAAAPAPARETVSRSAFVLPGGDGTLTVEQGSALARADAEVGVGARAELRLTQPPTRGSAEIRIRREGDASYGVLGSSPDVAGSTRVSFGGSFPRPEGLVRVTYEVWVHFESDADTVDSAPLIIEVTATRRGEEARSP